MLKRMKICKVRNHGYTKFRNLLLIIGIGIFLSCQPESNESPPPNIVVILADDMGYSDLGCTGAEINTPNLDNLADNGLLFTHMYNTSRCCPSRASLLTGLYQHRAGIGAMVQNLGMPAYQGYLDENSVTIAEVLQQKGYRTIMAGKWHVGDERQHWPDRRGFDQFYGIPKGGGLYFYPSDFLDRPIYKNGERVFPDSTTFYSTDNFTDESIGIVEEAVKQQQPFFLYLAYIAPHYPLQAWPEDIKKYEGKYDAGYDAIRRQRFEKQKELGLVPPDLKISPAEYPDWSLVENKEEEVRKMQVYAAQVDRMDQNIGKLVRALEAMEALDNTIIMFLSDNGACAQEENWAPGAKIGTNESFVSYGKNWANVSNTPFRQYKAQEHEGGIATPLIVHWPRGLKNTGKYINEPVHINDIMPTCLELADAEYPDHYQDRIIKPLDGKSFASFFRQDPDNLHDELYWEHLGNKAVRKGEWKLVKLKNQPWELYNLENDPLELKNMVRQKIDLKDSLANEWQQWANYAGVEPWPIEKNSN